MMRQLVILAGGKGTRLRTVTGDLPKPMAPIAGVPVLEHQVRTAARDGFDDIIFLTSYRSDVIHDHFGDGSQWGVRFRYLIDESPLGTAGATLAVLDQLADEFLMLYGDVMHDVDLRTFADAHHPGTAATLFVHPNDHPQDSDLVEITPDGLITAFHGYPHPAGVYRRNIVNAGLYALSREALKRYTALQEKLDFGKDLFPRMLADGLDLRAYFSREYIKDMGTPARWEKVNRHATEGRITRLHHSNPVPAIFLDRDGTLIRHLPFLNQAEQVELLPDAAAALNLLHEAGFLLVLVTNQPVIARGECDLAGLDRIHGRMEFLLGEEHAFLDAIYHCPHHPDSGFEGEVPELKIPCRCRKPEPGMIEKATRDLNIDLAASWMIGDSTRDAECARRAGIPCALVRGGEGTDESFLSHPEASVFNSLLDAAESILHSAIGNL
jgi:histidinol-phosphate phosphatase family protein